MEAGRVQPVEDVARCGAWRGSATARAPRASHGGRSTRRARRPRERGLAGRGRGHSTGQSPTPARSDRAAPAMATAASMAGVRTPPRTPLVIARPMSVRRSPREPSQLRCHGSRRSQTAMQVYAQTIITAVVRLGSTPRPMATSEPPMVRVMSTGNPAAAKTPSMPTSLRSPAASAPSPSAEGNARGLVVGAVHRHGERG